MDKIQDILITIVCWIIGGFLLLLSLTIFLPHGFIFGLLFLLAAIVSIPLTAAKLEQKLKVPLSGIVRFFAVFLLVAIAISTLPPATPTAIDNNTSIAAPPLAVSGSDVIAVPSEPAVTPTPAPAPIPTQAAAPTPAPIPDKKGTLDIVTNPTGATVTIDGVSQGTTPVSGLSIDAGTHAVGLYLAGYDLHKETVNLANSETKSILWAFVPDTSQSPTPSSTPEVTSTETPSTTTTDSGSIIANSNTKVYHNTGCRYVSTIKPEHLTYFNNRQEAETDGYRACKVCGG